MTQQITNTNKHPTRNHQMLRYHQIQHTHGCEDNFVCFQLLGRSTRWITLLCSQNGLHSHAQGTLSNMTYNGTHVVNYMSAPPSLMASSPNDRPNVARPPHVARINAPHRHCSDLPTSAAPSRPSRVQNRIKLKLTRSHGQALQKPREKFLEPRGAAMLSRLKLNKCQEFDRPNCSFNRNDDILTLTAHSCFKFRRSFT